MTRSEHMTWCKARALAYLDRGDVSNAVASMISDLEKHEGTSLRKRGLEFLALVGMAEIGKGPAAVKHWVEGFN